LFRQAKKLDAIGLDHGQLGGKGKNILVKKNGKPIIIDFEKASDHRRVHNQTQLEAFLFKNPHSGIAKRIRALLGKD
jgi:predicted Ser/Thr protein kinase